MKNKWKKMLASLMCGLLVFGILPIQSTYAATDSSVSSITDSISDNETLDSQGVENVEQADESTEAQTNQDLTEETEKSTDAKINYLYVESPYLETPAQENIVLSIGDGTQNVSNVRLIYSDENGINEEWGCSEQKEETFLFEKSFENSEQNSYQIVSVKYNENGEEKEENLASIGIDAWFGVNKTYEGYQPYESSEEDISDSEVEASIVTIDGDTSAEEAAQDVSETLVDTQTLVDGIAVQSGIEENASRNKDLVVVIDPGHGGKDSGATANGLYEKNLTLSIAKYCREELEKYAGVKVYMTRESDTYPTLTERVELAKNWGADVLVSIHINSADATGANGAEVWYPNSNYNAEIHNEGQVLAGKIQKELVALGLTDRKITTGNSKDYKYPDGSVADSLSIIRNSKLNGFPGIIVEHAFISNPSDAAKLKQDSFLKQLGIADATGIANTYGLIKKTALNLQVSNKNDFAGTANIQVSGVGTNGEIVVSNENGTTRQYSVSAGSATVVFDIKDFSNARGTYKVQAYTATGELKKEITFYVSKDVSRTISATSVDDKDMEVLLKTKFADMPAEVVAVNFAVWSAENGQDDLIWYNGSQKTSGEWTATANIQKHKTAGTYNVHVYTTLSDGTQLFLDSTNFEIENPTVSASISNYDKDLGTFDIIIKANSKSGIKSIRVPVWCAADQSDIKEYYAEKQNEGTYKVHVSVANHKYAVGTYTAHVYMTAGNGLTGFCGAGHQDVVMPEVKVSATNSDDKEILYNLKAANTGLLGNVRAVQFATWSVEGGQDDIIWYGGSRNSAGEWTATADIRKHKTAGTYNVHVYATMTDGSMRFLSSTTFEVSSPKVTAEIRNYDEGKGTFDVVVTPESKSGIQIIQVPVWCAGNQSDINWYTAEKQSDGKYVTHVSMSNHKYAVGSYKVHVYMTCENGLKGFVVAGQQEVTMPKVSISATNSEGKEILYNLKVSNAGLIGSVRNVQFATWSAEGGQDDIIWYGGSRNSAGEWTATADIRKHKTAGTYNVHVYATMTDGSMRFLSSTTFEVSSPKVTAEIRNYDEGKGTFDVVVTPESKSGIQIIQVPVWCAGNQSDINWYTAEKQSDGKYVTHVSMSNHKYAVGSYKVHVYMTCENGLKGFVVAGQQEVTMPKVSISATNSEGKEILYNLKVSNAGLIGSVRNVQFATWSAEGGQDDIIWYGGSRNSAGEWTATADIRKHKTAGTYNVHVYATMADGSMKLLGTTTFTVSNISLESGVLIDNYGNVDGSFEIIIPKVNSASGVSKVQVAVWCAANQNDIVWYNAKKQNDETYKVYVDPMNHKGNSGLYKVHVYVTGENGLVQKVDTASQLVTASKYYTIMGETSVTVDQMVKYYESTGNQYPAAKLGASGAATLKEFCEIYLQEAEAEGVRAEVAFAQSMKETGWLRYGGAVKIEQNNFAGIGAVDNDPVGSSAWFPDVRTGVRAQIQHLKAYASTNDLNNACVDPRFNLVTRGCAPYVEWLGTQENPNGSGWATSANYGASIVTMIKKLKTM